jgi:hypothetical protein
MTPADYAWLTGEQHRSWWKVIEQFRQQNDGVDLDDQEIDSWRDRSPPREIVSSCKFSWDHWDGNRSVGRRCGPWGLNHG